MAYKQVSLQKKTDEGDKNPPAEQKKNEEVIE
jgi:hypothetical protein